MMKNCKNTMLLAAMVAAASLSGVSQAQKILTPQTPIKTVKPVTTKAVPQRQEYTVNADEFYLKAGNYGFNSATHKKSFGSKCEIYRNWQYHKLEVKVGRNQDFPGSKCDFTLFEGKALLNGFVFKSYRGNKAHRGESNISMTSHPAAGGTSITFKFHGWDDPGGDTWAVYSFKEFILEGPAGGNWLDALR